MTGEGVSGGKQMEIKVEPYKVRQVVCGNTTTIKGSERVSWWASATSVALGESKR